MSQLVAYGRAAESPWLWLIIPAVGVALYAIGRFRKSTQAEERSFASVFLGGAPWWQQAIYIAIVGGGSLYYFATGHYQWYWWFLPTIAWLAFAKVVVTRRSLGARS